MKKAPTIAISSLFGGIALLLWLLSGCQIATPPRLATATAMNAAPSTPTPPPLQLTIDTTPTPQGDNPVNPAGSGNTNPALTVWVNETSPAHTALLAEMKAEFTAATGIDVELRQVEPMLLPELVNTAVLSNTLPDLILYPIAYSAGWGERGIFNPVAHTEVLRDLGAPTFDTDAVELLQQEGALLGLPSDGYHQLLLYRTDLFAAQGLAPPDNYAAMLAAAAGTTNRENARAGWVIPTESNLVTTHQAFEQIALANGCELIDEAGEVQLLTPACREAIQFYYDIVHDFSPFGVQTDTSARNAYLAGRTGMIMAPPSVLPMIAGLDAGSLPSCPLCQENSDYLRENTGIITALRGNGSQEAAATYSEIRVLSITANAPAETAVQFAQFWFAAGYDRWLSVDPVIKVPLRRGTESAPTLYVDGWGERPLTPAGPSLETAFGPEIAQQLRTGISTAPRWGISQGHGTLVTEIVEDLLFSVILQEMLSGYFAPERTIVELTLRVTELIPNYNFTIDPAILESINEN